MNFVLIFADKFQLFCKVKVTAPPREELMCVSLQPLVRGGWRERGLKGLKLNPQELKPTYFYLERHHILLQLHRKGQQHMESHLRNSVTTESSGLEKHSRIESNCAQCHLVTSPGH